MSFLKTIAFTIFIIVFYCFNVNSQTLTPAQIKTSLILKFTQNLKWNFIKKTDSFRIVVLGQDDEMLYELNKLSKLKKIGNLPVSIKIIFSETDIKEPYPQILYITSTFNPRVKNIYHKVLSHNCLMITNNCNENQFLMINFTEISQKIDFELNRITIFGQKIDISSKLMMLGGSDIDILELYNKLEKELDSAQLNVAEQNQRPSRRQR